MTEERGTHRRLGGGGRSAGAGSGGLVLLPVLRRRLLGLLRLLLPVLAVGRLRVLRARGRLVATGRLLQVLLLSAIGRLAGGHSGGLVGVGRLAAWCLLLLLLRLRRS